MQNSRTAPNSSRRKINLHPLRSLPKPMKAYVQEPFGFFYFWCAFIVIIVTVLGVKNSRNQTQTSYSASPVGESHTRGQIEVSGISNFKIKVKDKGTRVYLSDGTRLKLENTEKDLRLTSGGSGTVYRLKEKEGKLNLYDVSSLVYKLKLGDPNDYTIRLPDGTAAHRFKIKGSSFNIYDASGKRTRKGKFKSDYFTVKSKPENQRLLKIKGESKPESAASLSLPMQEPYRVLLWKYFQTQ